MAITSVSTVSDPRDGAPSVGTSDGKATVTEGSSSSSTATDPREGIQQPAK